MSRTRYNLARAAGACTLDRETWQSTVARAEVIERLRWPNLFDSAAPSPLYTHPRPERVWLKPDEMIIEARLVLNVEAEFALAESIQHEIRELAADDMDAARRQRLLRTIDELRDRIAKRGEPQ